MTFRNTSTSYGSIAKFFHWLIFLLLLFMVIYGFLLGDIPKDYQPTAYNFHKLLGLTILALMILRALWAGINPKPALPFGTPSWERGVERGMHFLLYVIVMAMPLAGWIGSVAGGRPPHIGNLNITLPIAQNKPLAETLFDLHNNLAIILIILVSLHILAALYHHFIKRDDILRRMLPHR